MMPIKQRIVMLRICAKTMGGEPARKFLDETALTLEGLSEQYNRLFEAAKQTLEDNAHFADGDICALIKLKRAMEAQGYHADEN